MPASAQGLPLLTSLVSVVAVAKHYTGIDNHWHSQLHDSHQSLKKAQDHLARAESEGAHPTTLAHLRAAVADAEAAHAVVKDGHGKHFADRQCRPSLTCRPLC